MTDRKTFMTYDYKEIEAERNLIPFLRDRYENFGWEVEEGLGKISTNSNQKQKV